MLGLKAVCLALGLFFEMGSCYVAHTDLELMSQVVGLQVRTTLPSSKKDKTLFRDDAASFLLLIEKIKNGRNTFLALGRVLSILF